MSRFCIIPSRVLSDPRFTSITHLRVLLALGQFADRNGWAWPSRAKLAETAGIQVSTARISQVLNDLEAWGYIERHAQNRQTDGGRSTNLYRVLYDVGGPVDLSREESPPVSPAYSPQVSPTYPPTPPKPHEIYGASKSHEIYPHKKAPLKAPENQFPKDGVGSSNSSDTREELLPPPTPESMAKAAAITDRALELTAMLRQRGAALQASDPRVRQWAADGVTDAQALQALEIADQRRAAKASSAPVGAGLLNAILDDVRASPPGRASPSQRPAAFDPVEYVNNRNRRQDHDRNAIDGQCQRVD